MGFQEFPPRMGIGFKSNAGRKGIRGEEERLDTGSFGFSHFYAADHNKFYRLEKEGSQTQKRI
jgi:hypothetical protein